MTNDINIPGCSFPQCSCDTDSPDENDYCWDQIKSESIYQFNIPIPATIHREASERRTILAKMPVDASYFFEGVSIKTLHALARREGVKTTMRKWREDGKNGVRVWRIA